ncbi:inactive protein kinase SELMODRAFT_444075 [Ziziphus jujuba]|uniref:Inactive protein kinase SELMODRAFT_444075 n=1 Tax=Ziziphus jujuba TaxID=326968 RepID=A0A6P6FMK7_ZIZJJ|nr:inactive protein kinase SELMODRAFT_444075 [Ziziphus jujuba]
MEREVILVAVDASKEITDYALAWALRNVTRPTDSLILLAVFPSLRRSLASSNNVEYGAHHDSRKSQFFSYLLKKLGIDCSKEKSSFDQVGLINGVDQGVFHRIHIVCEHMLQQLCSANDLMQVHTEVEVMADVQPGLIASKAKELEASWVILDRRLKRESDYCLKQVNCNIVLIDHAIPRILKSVSPVTGKNLRKGGQQSDQRATKMVCVLPSSTTDSNSATTRSSLGIESPIFDTDVSSSLSISDKDQLHNTSKPFLDLNSQYFDKKVGAQATSSKSFLNSKFQQGYQTSDSNTGKLPHKLLANPLYEIPNSFGGHSINQCAKEVNSNVREQSSLIPGRRSADSPRLRRNVEGSHLSKQPVIRRESPACDKSKRPALPTPPTIDRISSIRKAISLSIKQPPIPPPLCSICKHNAPILGKTPRKFSFKEIERATDGFSSKNFLAQGGYGPVYKGILPGGLVVAVKRHNRLSAQGAPEFCSEVEVLSCAQHRNLVMLVGYCIETEWLLIYEFACNGSLETRLFGTEATELMCWHNRMKVAIGAARGLRYLHEDCRVGCIVHRDFRPNNILLTHDFEPMVGDFGLARWQVDGQSAEDSRVIGAFGYLAPEYTQSGLITEKADVYAFGVVLLELLSGFEVTEFARNTGQQFVSEWASPLLESKKANEIIDPRLENNYIEKEVACMMHAASLCILPHPEHRPTMSKVLKILEGDVLTDMVCTSREHPSLCETQNINNRHATNQRKMKQTIDYNSLSNLLHSMDVMKLSPPRTGIHKSVNIGGSSNQQELDVSKEYQAYLHGSLAKFVQNMNGN